MAAEDWTEEKIKTLTRMWADGRTCSQIGAAIGMSRNAVIGKRCRIGLPNRGESKSKHRSRPRSTKYAVPEKRILTPPHIQALKAMEEEMKAAAPVVRTHDDAPVPLMIPLLDLTDQMCRWIVTDDRPFLYCAHETEPGTSYCEHHYRRMFAGRPVSRATRPMRRAA
jgi:GcrA cell cycle regulator